MTGNPRENYKFAYTRKRVYDVSGSAMWGGGDHMGHVAGLDLTLEIEVAPHADDVMAKMKVVGELAGP